MMDIVRFLDDRQRVKTWPSKQAAKIGVLQYIQTKFEENRTYTEKEVNAIIDDWHTFGDYFLIRRGLVDHKLLSRTRNGSSYWKV